MTLHWKRIVISILISLGVNMIFFVRSAAPVSMNVSTVDRIVIWLTWPAEKVTDWLIPGHVTLRQLIVMFSLSLIFYAIVVLVVVELASIMRSQMHKPSESAKPPTVMVL